MAKKCHLRFQSKDRLCSVHFKALPLFTWIEGPESHVTDAIGAAPGNCRRPGTQCTQWPSLLQWVMNGFWEGQRQIPVCTLAIRGRYTPRDEAIVTPLAVGVSNGVERRGQHHQQNKQTCGWRRAQSLPSAFRFWARVSGRRKRLFR